MIKDKLIHIIYSNRFYNRILKPFDKILYPLANEKAIVDSRKNRDCPCNKIAQVADLQNPEWAATLNQMQQLFSMDKNSFHRKHWEFVQLIYMLRKEGLLSPRSRGLAVGAGREPLVYFLTGKVKKITGIDLYASTFLGGEDETDIPENPEKYAPFVCPPGTPELLRMDALNLDFPDRSFDFVFSASSIEHFGRTAAISRSISEMYRVLKPGGSAAITTELKLNRLGGNIPNTRIFNLNELIDILEKPGFKVNRDQIDLRLEREHALNPVKLPSEILRRPHVILRSMRTLFTSVAFLLKKPGNQAAKGEFSTHTDFKPHDYSGQVTASTEDTSFSRNTAIPIEIRLRNTGNFKWYVHGSSHRIALGVRLHERNGNLIEQDFSQFTIPANVAMGDTITFSALLEHHLPPGDYQLQITLKREFITWFPEHTCPAARIDLTIRD